MGNGNAESGTATIYWHLGFQKTGTTTIQSWLTENDLKLAPHVALFVRNPAAVRLSIAGARFLRASRFLKPKILRHLRVKLAVKEVVKAVHAHPKRMALVSHENILGHYVFKHDISIFDHAAAIIPALTAYARPAQSHFIFYTRAFDGWLDSAWRQEVMALRCTEDFDTWKNGLPFDRSWPAQESRLQQALSESGATVTFRDMLTDGEEGLPMGGYLLQRAGVPQEVIDGLGAPQSKNIGVTKEAADFMVAVNSTDIKEKPRSMVRRVVEANATRFR